jgi:hypothetical protein
MEYPEGCEMYFKRSGGGGIKHVWNKVVRDFLQSDSDYLLSCHDDVVMHPGTLPRLMSWGLPLVSALVFMRQSPNMPHIWKSFDDARVYAMRVRDTHDWFMNHKEYIQFGPQVMEPRPDDALQEVSFTSTSCTLIHRSVLLAMNDPWFELDDEIGGGGEDRRFFENAKAAGFPGYVDRSCIVGHLVGDVAAGAADFMAWESVSRFMYTGEPEVDTK